MFVHRRQGLSLSVHVDAIKNDRHCEILGDCYIFVNTIEITFAILCGIKFRILVSVVWSTDTRTTCAQK